ncbi:sigma-70 family RNA polymerase sigma factor [Streptomyces sp. TRM70350]|uniref:sigma-70 family RNA polymerase sigma factor n=1 Tax=Streptomyces sp. TRM70350 TaxID=2856165 RepID=UPI001C43F1CA|nr:sigma-70 family RNA polymerase sigma factor [Streptomyces sp. TRM70350]MBV7699588.1 sigma-70 family RNA polymerase sigma factor [Streptomyces sp. TRM70350]
MSADGRDESRGDEGGEVDGPTAPQVPAQRERREDSVLPPPIELPPSDTELIGRMRTGDDTAYEELYRRHAQAVRRYARTCCRDPHTADDLTAEVFARMLQAVRGGHGPEHAVRAYLLTTVRRVAAHWTNSARREHLVDDFAVFAAQSARASEVSDTDTLDLGADVRALHAAEQSLAMRAFRSLPERWQAVLWHTEVEDESPSEVATLFGLDANGTRVLASRAREGLRQAYLQAHVSATLTSDEECARYADQLGTYARGRLRTRAERGLRKHLEECARCRLAATQIEELASGIPAVVPVAVIGWFGAAGYAKAAGIVAGGAGAGAAGVASGGGGAAASEGLGAPVKAGVAAGVAATAIAVVAIALAGNDVPAERKPAAKPPASAPAAQPEPPPPTPPVQAPEPPPAPPVIPAANPTPTPAPSPTPTPTPTPTPEPTPTPRPTPPPTPTPTPPPAPTPPPPVSYQLNELSYDATGDGTEPELRLSESGWVWQRYGLSIGGTAYARGVSVHARSSVTVDLNRACTSYDALVGVDDSTMGLGTVSFSVYADGARLWKSGLIRGGDAATPVHVNLTGHRTVRLVVQPHGHVGHVGVADWAESEFTCG